MTISENLKCTLFVFPVITFLLLGFCEWQACGFIITDDNKNTPDFKALLDLQNRYIMSGAERGIKSNSSIWGRWANAKSFDGSFLGFSRGFLGSGGRHLQRQGLTQPMANFLLKRSNGLFGKHGRNFMNRYGVMRGTPLDEILISNEEPRTHVRFWSKRDTNSQVSPREQIIPGATYANISEKYSMMDKELENEHTDPRCKDRLGLCAMNTLKNLECVLHCHLSIHALATPSTKFLFRLLKVYASYPKMMCPTFGTIYNEIPSILQHQRENSLLGFLYGLGIVDEAPVNVDFIKNSPSALFNNVVKFGNGEDLEMVQSIVDTAETAAAVTLSEQNLFPSKFGNPFCKLNPKEGWFVSLIEATTKHPSLTDIFLRGYWILTRALTMELQYPLDVLFVSIVYALKLMSGVSCSIISYAEQGKPFKCQQPLPLQDILDSYSDVAEDEDPYSWLVCGAHQVGIPDWIQGKEDISGRDEDSDNNSTTDSHKPFEAQYDDLNEFPNPDELYPLDKN